MTTVCRFWSKISNICFRFEKGIMVMTMQRIEDRAECFDGYFQLLVYCQNKSIGELCQKRPILIYNTLLDY
jgi:hypothetical protein